jgi:signal transduction histidine kinase
MGRYTMRQAKEKIETKEELVCELEQLRRRFSAFETYMSEYRQIQEKTQQQNEFLIDILYSVPFPQFVVDARDFTIKHINPVAKQGKDSLSENTKCYSYIHKKNEPCSGSGFVCMLEQVKKKNKFVVVEHTYYDEDGNPSDVDILGSPIFDREGKIIYMVETLVDISKRKKAETQLLEYQKELRSLASQLSLAEERERRRIATEVHDRISQAMAVCSIKLGALLESASSTRLAKDINEINTLIKQMISDTRTLTFELSSPLLYDLGLEAAIEQLTEQMREQYGIQFTFTNDGQSKPLDNDVRILIFQATRELLVNAMKHSQARHVNVIMKKYNGYLCTTIQDDGIGFDTSQLNSYMKKLKGFGLFSIRERLHLIGGQMEVKSTKGYGTRVVLTVPLNQK